MSQLPPAIAVPHDDAIDTTDGEQVLDFVYEYLARRGLPPSDDHVRSVSLPIARCGARSVSRRAIESLLAERRPNQG